MHVETYVCSNYMNSHSMFHIFQQKKIRVLLLKLSRCHVIFSIWLFPTIGVLQNRWFIMENPIKMDDLRVPLFLETPISFHIFLGGLSFFPSHIPIFFPRQRPPWRQWTNSQRSRRQVTCVPKRVIPVKWHQRWRRERATKNLFLDGSQRGGWSGWVPTRGKDDQIDQTQWLNFEFSRTHHGRLTWKYESDALEDDVPDFQWSSLRLVPYKSHINPI